MNYFIFLITALSVRVSGYNYYENNNLENNQYLIDYENQNLFGIENLYAFENYNQNSIKVVNYNNLGQVSCATKQPLCATNGQHYLYFENPCQFEIRNYEELIQGKQEYFQCPLNFCQPQCAQCSDVYDPVCAMELQTRQLETFQNSCEVDRRACLTNKAYSIVSHSKCSQLDSQNYQCPELCTQEYRPICAKFDNEFREFSNNCELERTRCNTNIAWQLFHEGPCFPVPDNTEPLKCPNICTLEYRPICAKFNNDLREFGNTCDLQRTICQTNNDWQIVNIGPCPENTSKCPKYCTKDLNPVCARFGTETREFLNICELQKTICETNIVWQLDHKGPCFTEPAPQECPNFCNREFKPVCARFGAVTREFSNSCELQRTICETNIAWTILNNGSCQEQQSSCQNEEFKPICARVDINIKTFRNLCELAEEIMITGKDWYILYSGKCQNSVQPTLETYFTTTMSSIPISTAESSTSLGYKENFTTATTTTATPVIDDEDSSLSTLDITETTTPETRTTTPLTLMPSVDNASANTVPTTAMYTTTPSYYSGYSEENYIKSFSNVYSEELNSNESENLYANGNEENFEHEEAISYKEILNNSPTFNDSVNNYDNNSPDISYTDTFDTGAKPEEVQIYNDMANKYPLYEVSPPNFIYTSENNQELHPYNQPLTVNNPLYNYPGMLINQPNSDYVYSQFQPNNPELTQNYLTNQPIPDYLQRQPYNPSLIHKSPFSSSAYDFIPYQTYSRETDSYGAQPPSFKSMSISDQSIYNPMYDSISDQTNTKEADSYGAQQPTFDPRIPYYPLHDSNKYGYAIPTFNPTNNQQLNEPSNQNISPQMYPPITAPVASFNSLKQQPNAPCNSPPSHNSR